NIPTSTELLSIPNGASMNLYGAYEGYGINSSGTAVTDLSSAWNGRHVTLYSANALTFKAGGTSGSAICNDFTSTANIPVEARYYGCWYLK
ncbi:META domain-containing protein, partial [Gluconobacter oxydans]